MNSPVTYVSFLASLILLVATWSHADVAQPIPNPNIYLTHTEYVVVGGKEFKRYHFDVFNKDAFPAALFESAPSLAPCGTNTNASRTWIDLYAQSGKRLNGFCAIRSSNDLNDLWFALESDVLPPSWIYIEFTDRQTNRKYKSNLADTVQ